MPLPGNVERRLRVNRYCRLKVLLNVAGFDPSCVRVKTFTSGEGLSAGTGKTFYLMGVFLLFWSMKAIPAANDIKAAEGRRPGPLLPEGKI